MSLDRAPQICSSFQVAKSDLRRWQWQESAIPAAGALAPGQVLVAITKFAFTANNMTYAHLGSPLAYTTIGYWNFFPAPDGWGQIPVWGIGEVVASKHAQLPVGERFYGFFPMATHLTMTLGDVGGVTVVDVTAHRVGLSPIYNEYRLIERDPAFDLSREDAYLILRPGFSLSFCCAVYLQEQNHFGARRILLTSASSKAALGMALLLTEVRQSNLEIVGLTSPDRAKELAARGIYDHVVGYDEVTTLSTDVPTGIVDIANGAALREALDRHLGGCVKHYVIAGFTQRASEASARPVLRGPGYELFSTPAHMVERRKQWGDEIFWQRYIEAWRRFQAFTAPWMTIKRTSGCQGVETIYQEVLDGKTPTETAHILSAWPDKGEGSDGPTFFAARVPQNGEARPGH